MLRRKGEALHLFCWRVPAPRTPTCCLSNLEEEGFLSKQDAVSGSISQRGWAACRSKAQTPASCLGTAPPGILGKAVLEVGSTLSWAKSKCFLFVLKSSRIITDIYLSLAGSAPSLPPSGPPPPPAFLKNVNATLNSLLIHRNHVRDGNSGVLGNKNLLETYHVQDTRASVWTKGRKSL